MEWVPSSAVIQYQPTYPIPLTHYGTPDFCGHWKPQQDVILELYDIFIKYWYKIL